MWIYIVFSILVLGIVVFLVGLYMSKGYIQTTYNFKSKKIENSIKIVFLADIHNKVFCDNNEKILSEIKVYNPDLILMPGDIIISKSAKSRKDLNIAEGWLKELTAICPVYFSNGNHESRIRNEEFFTKEKFETCENNKIYDELYEIFHKYNVICLNNESIYCKPMNIKFSGLELLGKYYKRGKKAELDTDVIIDRVGECDKEVYNILLAHNPDYFKAYDKWGADLTVSGHLHGGVMRLPFWGGVISPSLEIFPKYDSGLYEGHNGKMIVSKGIGCHTLPIRLFNPAELIFIKIDSDKR